MNGKTIEWLLEKENPSVRYFTLTELLGTPEDSDEVIVVKKEIMNSGMVPGILEHQHPEGYWETPADFYMKKYTGTVWQLLILAELQAYGSDPRIRNACEFILSHSQDLESSGFSVHTSAKAGGGRHSEVIPCLTGNLLWALIRFGYLHDERVQKGIGWILKYQRFDDGVAVPPAGWPYDKFETCWGRHTCHMGIVKALKAFAEIPSEERTKEIRESIQYGVEFILQHHIYKKSHDLAKKAKPGWLKLGFPLMYQTDILEILLILAKLGYRDPRMKDAADIVASKQDGGGIWKLENSYNGSFYYDIEEKGKPSKWITLNSLRILKRFESA
jgi:hypothetical protein